MFIGVCRHGGVHGIGRELAMIAHRHGNHFVACRLNRACFMHGNVAALRGNHGLVWAQHGFDDDGIALGAAADKVYLRLRSV